MPPGITEVSNCRACGSLLPTTPVFDLGPMAAVDFPVRADAPAVVSPLTLLECPGCSLVQLQHTVEPDILFKEFWYRSGVTNSMKAALCDVVRAAEKIAPTKDGDTVLDIGTNDGTLLGFYPREIEAIGFEPAINIAAEASLKGFTIIPEYFERAHLRPEWEHKFKHIFAIAMFYDVSDPGEFLECVRQVLHPEGVFIVQMNYLQLMLENLAVDNIGHEHLCYYSARAFRRLAGRYGLRLVKIETNAVNGGSIRLFLRHGTEDSEQASRFIKGEDAPDRPGWGSFMEELATIRSAARHYLLIIRKAFGARLSICGASTRGLTTLHFLGLGNETLSMAGDRDPHKHGRYYGATGIPIVNEEQARAESGVMLVLPWHFAEEIIKREAAFLAGGGELVFPFPRPKVVTKDGEFPL